MTLLPVERVSSAVLNGNRTLRIVPIVLEWDRTYSKGEGCAAAVLEVECDWLVN